MTRALALFAVLVLGGLMWHLPHAADSLDADQVLPCEGPTDQPSDPGNDSKGEDSEVDDCFGAVATLDGNIETTGRAQRLATTERTPGMSDWIDTLYRPPRV